MPALQALDVHLSHPVIVSIRRCTIIMQAGRAGVETPLE